MSVLASKLKDKTETHLSSAELYHPYVFALGGVGILITLWATLTLGTLEYTRLLFQLFILNISAQLAITAIRKTNTVFNIGSAVNLATIAVFGMQAGILVAFFSAVAIWLIPTVRKKPPLKQALKVLSFNTGIEIITLFISGFFLLAIRHWVQIDWLIFKPLEWFIAAIVNNQLTVLLTAGMLYMQKGIHPKDFWQNNTWSMPINITISALGGALLSAAVAVMGFRGILTFLVPLVLAAYTFHMYIHSADQRFALLQNRTSDLEIANQQLTLLSQRKEKIFESTATTMQTSLTAIRKTVQIMLETQNFLTHERQMELLNTIATNEEILRDIVTNAGVVEGKQEDGDDLPQMRLFNLSELIEGVTEAFADESAEKQIRLRCQSGDVPLHIEADENMIRQVVHHLVSNAIKFTPAGGSVFVSLVLKDNTVLLNVEDTGFGIAKSEIASIFNPYYRSQKHESSTSGKGLGLAIVKRYVQAHDGTVSVESEVDLGSHFTIILPLHESILPRNSEYSVESTVYTTHEFFLHAREKTV